MTTFDTYKDLKPDFDKPYYQIINTMQPLRHQIEKILESVSLTEKIAILESLGKKYRKENSIKINSKDYGKKVDIRTDEINLKDGKG